MKNRVGRVEVKDSDLIILIRIHILCIRLLWHRLYRLSVFLHLGFQRWVIGMPTAQCWDFNRDHAMDSMWHLKKNTN